MNRGFFGGSLFTISTTCQLLTHAYILFIMNDIQNFIALECAQKMGIFRGEGGRGTD